MNKTKFLAILLPIQVLFVQWFSNFSNFIEIYYSNGIYSYISQLLRILFGWLPFSFGDLLIFTLLFLLVRSIVLLIKHKFKNFIPKIINFIASLSVIYFCFYLFWGLNYYRKPLSENLGYTSKKYTTEQLTATTHKIIEQLNFYQYKITKNDTLKVTNTYKVDEMYDMSVKAYGNLAKDFPQLAYKHKSVKSSLMSLLQTYNGTSGYLNPLTGEAQVNDKIPKTGYPTTVCHEMAHQIGFAAENEANFIGFLAANYHQDAYFKYASYRMAFGYCISELRKRNPKEAKITWQKVNKGVIKDFRASSQFWQSYENPFEPIVKKGYSAYLKANNQKQGIASYNYVVDLLISYFETKSLINQ
jgi:hypothetical protein